MNKNSYKNLAVNILLLLASALFCTFILVFIIEARYFIETKNYLRCAWHDPNTKFDPELGWSPIPNRNINQPDSGVLSSNSLGFRSAEIDQNKKQIIILGDSFAWGFGVSDNETFPYYLGEMVSKSGYQVSNLAVSGYSIDQYYLFLKRHIDKFNNLKQIVLVIYSGNDLQDTGRNFNNGTRKPLFYFRNNNLVLTDNSINEYCLKNLFSRSYFLGRSGLMYKKSFIRTILNQIFGDKLLNSIEAQIVIINLLQRINELALSHNAKLLIVVNPSKEDLVEKSVSLKFFEYIFNKLKYNHINYILILKNQRELNSFYLMDGHYSKKGNMFLAKTVYEYLYKKL